jgi:trans-AT polyketide synthase/acyltransferase/oxidoreductase domain-containing protein
MNKKTAYLFPGQGSQYRGMGEELFKKYRHLADKADQILGYSIEDLCLNNTDNKLNNTRYTQPALYTVNCLYYIDNTEKQHQIPDVVAGHSLGEYNALYAAGIFDFETGLRLVIKRGELMSLAKNGGMAAVLDISADQIIEILKNDDNYSAIDIANYNDYMQTVIAGPTNILNFAKKDIEKSGGRYIPLNVSAAFHSRYMSDYQDAFKEELQKYNFSVPRIKVYSNVDALPYQQTSVVHNLTSQITSSVMWTDIINNMRKEGVDHFQEIGPGKVLTKLTEKIVAREIKITEPIDINSRGARNNGSKYQGLMNSEKVSMITKEELGSRDFRKDYNLKYSYVTGAMYKGIASKELVVKVAKAGMLAFLGTGGLSINEIERAITFIQRNLGNNTTYGANLLNNLNEPELEERTVDLYLAMGVKHIEAAAYMQNLSIALIKYRIKGLQKRADGVIEATNKIIAKVSRPEVAAAFMSHPPEKLLHKLLAEHKITNAEADMARQVAVADDICVEADSGGHTDMGVAYTLMPAMVLLRDEKMKEFQYSRKINVGAAGGIGTPESAAAAFILGADFILTGSINQCTVESGNSDVVKDLLETMNVQDVAYAPAGDMFEIGAKVQVLRKKIFFPARANKLYDLYMSHNSIEEIDDKTKTQIQNTFFKKSFDDVYRETIDYWSGKSLDVVKKAEENAKFKMALIFKWYFAHSTRLALNGVENEKVDFQVHTGPALGAFNQWVKGTPLASWRNRHVDEIGIMIMEETANLLNRRFQALMLST